MITAISNLTGLFGPASVAGASIAQPSAAPAQDFGQVLSSVVGDAVSALKSGEAASIAGIEGKLPAREVVDGILAGERSLQTALAVRDKLVSAFQEISRLSI